MKFDVIVAGGGAVGAASALALQRAGFSVALIERGARPAPFDPGAYDPRVYALAPGTMRFLDSLGAWGAIESARVSPYTRMQVWDRSQIRSMAFDAAELAVRELGWIVEDALIRASLWSALGGVTVHANAQIAQASFEGKPQLKLAGGAMLEAELIVAAEGADSPLRAAAGLEPDGWSYSQRAIVCHVETEKPHEGSAYQRFLPEGVLALLPLADGRSSIVWSVANARADALLAMDDDHFREELGFAIEFALGDIRAASPRLAFPLKMQHAATYVRPGLALVGDSAHVVHPLAGQGMNLGLMDAQALADVIGEARAARRPLGSVRFLQKYERRRRSAAIEVIALTDGLHRLFALDLPGMQGLREFGMRMFDRSGPLKRVLASRAMGI